MRVLMQSRKNFYTMPGGDTMQLLKTKEQLEALGVDVDISLEYEPDLSEYDLVHLSNVTRVHETFLQMRNAKRQNKPVVLSTIFWPMEEFERNGQTGIRGLISRYLRINDIERIKAIARWLKDPSARNKATVHLITTGYIQMQQYVIENADVFLPNADLEMEQVRKCFGVQENRYVVVPNGIDDMIARKNLKADVPEKFLQYQDAVICVGRIETRKNQLALVKALDGAEHKLILVGAVSDNHKGYFEEINKYLERNPNFVHISQIPNEELYQLYRVCKVSTLPSWLDTPGLVSLEAAAMGCNLAISTRGTTREYFADEAYYCEPDDIDSIKQAIQKAYEAPKSLRLQAVVMEKYTWKEAARATLEGYQLALQRG